jgi:flagellar hook-associated protein 3 FlgL
MRITDKMRFKSTRSDMNRLQNRSSKIYKELSSGKRINRPSDDPFGALQATGLTTHKRLLDQYGRNIDTARINLYAADNALSQAVDIMTEARTVTISSVSAIGDEKSHSVMADSIGQLKERLFNLSNSRVGETYIFAGTQSTRKPYTLDQVTGKISYIGDMNSMKLEIGEGSLVNTTLEGTGAFGGGSALASISAGSGYTGQPAVIGEYDGSLGNVHVDVTAMNPGDPSTATFSVTFDGGATIDDNGGVGYTLAELNTSGPLGGVGVQLRLPGSTSFNPGDQVNLTLIQSEQEDVFALFDELELALREFDDVTAVGNVDYDGNGIADAQDLIDAQQAVIDENTYSAANPIQNPLTGAELNYFVSKARDDRFEELANARVQNLLGRIDNSLNQISDSQSLVGLGLNKVDSSDAANEFLNEQVQTTLAQVQDSDFIEAVSELNLVETALQAATSTTSRVLQGISLLDYLG